MARRQTSHQKTLAKHRSVGRVTEGRELQEGDVVSVTHFFADNDPVEYQARIHFDANGRCQLEPLDASERLAQSKARMVFYSTFPMLDYLDWFLISNLPVLLNRYTRMCFVKCMSARMIQRAAFAD